MEVKAELKQLRISPRKVRLVSGVIKGLDVNRARFQLQHVVKRSSLPMLKLLNSAIANATNNFDLEENNLYIKDVNVDEGRKLKRGQPKGFGRISPIEKKTSHIRIILSEKVAGVRANKKETKSEVSAKSLESKSFDKTQDKKPEIKKSIRLNKDLASKVESTGKKFFRRKAV